jgi:hypothetical protein
MRADAGARELLGPRSYGVSVLCRSCAWTFGGVAVSQTLARRSYAQTRAGFCRPRAMAFQSAMRRSDTAMPGRFTIF